MAGNNIGSYLVVTIIVVLFFTMISLTGQEVLDKNPNLDQASLDALTAISTQIDTNYDIDELSTALEDNLTSNSSFEGTDAFQREFLESKTEAEDKRSLFGRITGVPDLFLAALGVTNDSIVLLVKSLLLIVIGFMLALAVYKGWKTGEVDG